VMVNGYIFAFTYINFVFCPQVLESQANYGMWCLAQRSHLNNLLCYCPAGVFIEECFAAVIVFGNGSMVYWNIILESFNIGMCPTFIDFC